MCDKHAFAFDVDKAYADQLTGALEGSPQHPLSQPEAQATIGVYALYQSGRLQPVYVGKVDSGPGLRRRLAEHAQKIEGRENVNLADMTCPNLTVARKWEVARAEDQLIKHYHPPWNKITGFGSHIPGSGRPGRPGYLNQGDQQYPPKGSS